VARHARIVHEESELGCWTRVFGSPDPLLRPLLHRPHCGFVQHAARFDRWIEPPPPALTLIISLEGQIGTGAEGLLPGAWMTGLADAAQLIELPGRQALIDVKLAPLGAYTLLGRPLSELAGTVVSLDELFGAAGWELSERLRDLRGWDERFATVDAFLAGRAAGGPPPNPTVARALERLRESGGRLAIGALAAELGCSRRYLAARFAEQVGLPPKSIARLLRFESVRRRLAANPVRWADIAHDCGYCDQSHLNRDFGDLAGTTPTDFLARQIPGGGVIGDEFPIVQDAHASVA